MSRVTPLVITAALVLIFCTSVLAAIETRRGDEEGFWETYSVICGAVLQVHDSENGKMKVKLNPKATIAGTFDPAAQKTLPLDIYHGERISSITKPPQVGETIVVVIQQKDSKWAASSSWFEFMPTSSAMCVVEDLDDPRIIGILNKIREIRVPRSEEN